ncbi:hypothetical protein ACIRQQ_38020 [Streptomyces fuscichromogenes]|uniref:hypothetical protein n=1 Tax=Streptomyces fuscichromogenes TaxID=1324013 RepID=UPI003827609B
MHPRGGVGPVPAGPPLREDFGVGGAGGLVGVADGNPHHVDSFQRPRRHTWRGRALAVLSPAKRPGRRTPTATAPGLRPAALELPVRTANS